MKEKFFISKLPKNLFQEKSFDGFSMVYADATNQQFEKEAFLKLIDTLEAEPIFLREIKTEILLLVWKYNDQYFAIPTVQAINKDDISDVSLFAAISNKQKALVSNKDGVVDSKQLLTYLNQIIDDNEGTFVTTAFVFEPGDVFDFRGLESLHLLQEDETVKDRVFNNELVVVKTGEESDVAEEMGGLLRMGNSICMFPIFEIKDNQLYAYLGNAKYGAFYVGIGTKEKLNESVSEQLRAMIQAIDSFVV